MSTNPMDYCPPDDDITKVTIDGSTEHECAGQWRSNAPSEVSP